LQMYRRHSLFGMVGLSGSSGPVGPSRVSVLGLFAKNPSFLGLFAEYDKRHTFWHRHVGFLFCRRECMPFSTHPRTHCATRPIYSFFFFFCSSSIKCMSHAEKRTVDVARQRDDCSLSLFANNRLVKLIQVGSGRVRAVLTFFIRRNTKCPLHCQRNGRRRCPVVVGTVVPCLVIRLQETPYGHALDDIWHEPTNFSHR